MVFQIFCQLHMWENSTLRFITQLQFLTKSLWNSDTIYGTIDGLGYLLFSFRDDSEGGYSWVVNTDQCGTNSLFHLLHGTSKTYWLIWGYSRWSCGLSLLSLVIILFHSDEKYCLSPACGCLVLVDVYSGIVLFEACPYVQSDTVGCSDFILFLLWYPVVIFLLSFLVYLDCD